MRYILALIFLYPFFASGYQVAVRDLVLTAAPSSGYIGWTGTYLITGGPEPVQDSPVNCGGARVCFITFAAYLTDGSDPTRDIDRASATTPQPTVLAGVSWNQAISTFIRLHGRSGALVRPPVSISLSDYDPRHLCFILMAGKGDWGDSGRQRVPGVACSYAAPPEVSCESNFPRMLNLGVVPVGSTAVHGQSQGLVTCSGPTVIRARLMNRPTIDRRAVDVTVNGRLLGNTDSRIGEGRTVPIIVSAQIPQPLMNAGTYTTDAVIALTYE